MGWEAPALCAAPPALGPGPCAASSSSSILILASIQACLSWLGLVTKLAVRGAAAPLPVLGGAGASPRPPLDSMPLPMFGQPMGRGCPVAAPPLLLPCEAGRR